MLGLKDRLNHLPSQLSGGEQQRVAVARALINNPAIIFADEPSGNLDSKNAQELHDLFFKLRDEFNQTFVIVTHNEELAQLSDRVLYMKDGKIVFDGTPPKGRGPSARSERGIGGLGKRLLVTARHSESASRIGHPAPFPVELPALSSNGNLTTLITSLLASSLDIKILGLGLNAGTLLAAILSPVTLLLDTILNPLLSTLGVSLGNAAVTVDSITTQRPQLVNTCLPGTVNCQ
mgnify:CR=1 FL=1